MEEKLLSINEAAKLLDVCENTLRDWDIEGKFKATRTTGGHRRYSLDQIREYLTKYPPKEKESSHIKNLAQEKNLVIKKWEHYLENVDENEKFILATILDTNALYFKVVEDPILSTNQCIWLIKNGWLRSKFRKMVSVQPLTGPVGLAYYLDYKNDSQIINSSAVSAHTQKYNFGLFSNAPFEQIKDVYADALAAEIDLLILNELRKTKIEDLINAISVHPYELNESFDYIIATEDQIERLENTGCTNGVDLFAIDACLDKNFELIGVAGKYPKNGYIFSTPIFLPYVLLNFSPKSSGPMQSIYIRCGWFDKEVKNDEVL